MLPGGRAIPVNGQADIRDCEKDDLGVQVLSDGGHESADRDKERSNADTENRKATVKTRSIHPMEQKSLRGSEGASGALLWSKVCQQQSRNKVSVP